MKLQSKLSTEVGVREADENVINNRISDLTADVAEIEQRLGAQVSTHLGGKIIRTGKSSKSFLPTAAGQVGGGEGQGRGRVDGRGEEEDRHADLGRADGAEAVAGGEVGGESNLTV